jgi:phosphoglycolate phosphatase-like HAD superfamily hydrolase
MGGRLRRYTMGSYERLDTKAAREAADKAWALIDKGVDPGEQKRARRAAPDLNETVNAVSAAHLERYVATNCRPSTYRETSEQLGPSPRATPKSYSRSSRGEALRFKRTERSLG